MNQVLITATDLTTHEQAEKVVNRGNFRNLQHYLDGIVFYDDFQHLVPNSNKAFTDMDMVMESAGYLISVEFKHSMKGLNVGQLLLAQNLAATGSNIFLFVFGDMNNPTHYFKIESGGQAIKRFVPDLITLKNGKQGLKDVLIDTIRFTEQYPLVNTNVSSIQTANQTINHVKMQYYLGKL